LIEFKQSGKSINEYVATVKTMKQRIETATDLLEQLTVMCLINGLDEKFAAVKHGLLATANIKLDDCCNRIWEHGGCLEQEKVSKALKVYNTGKSGKPDEGGHRKCPTCKKAHERRPVQSHESYRSSQLMISLILRSALVHQRSQSHRFPRKQKKIVDEESCKGKKFIE
jgi:hypothetical protein